MGGLRGRSDPAKTSASINSLVTPEPGRVRSRSSSNLLGPEYNGSPSIAKIKAMASKYTATVDGFSVIPFVSELSDTSDNVLRRSVGRPPGCKNFFQRHGLVRRRVLGDDSDGHAH